MEQPSAVDAEWLNSVAPRAVAWYAQQEAALLPRGRLLTPAEVQLARDMGVQRPEQVRVLVWSDFPFPDDPILAKELKGLGMGSRNVGGFGLGYVVLVKPKYDGERWLLAHELVHVAQRERLGTDAFVRRYLLELRVLGYARAPLELEANQLMRKA